MSKEFFKEQMNSETRPPAFVKLNVRSDYIQRCNITRLIDADGNPTNQWMADSRIISKDEYIDIFATLATPSHDELLMNQEDTMDGLTDIFDSQVQMESDQVDSMDAITDLYASQEQIKSDQLDIMEAIADIYTILDGGAE